MNASLTASVNSTIVRSRTSLWALVRAYFAIASRLLPDLARRQAERLFTLPPRYASRNTQTVDARRETVVAGKHSLAVWQVGPAAAPAVLLVHGWGGRGVQMGSFVAPLLARGYRIVWFDQPGHGESGRGLVALRRGSAWPSLGARYERADERTDRSGQVDTPAEPNGEIASQTLWDAIERGEDPSKR